VDEVNRTMIAWLLGPQIGEAVRRIERYGAYGENKRLPGSATKAKQAKEIKKKKLFLLR
jgi:hypothetical protein